MRLLSVILAVLVLLSSCQKSEEVVDQGNYMRLEISAYHPDTSVFANVKVNDVVLTNSQQYHGDEIFNIFLQRDGTVFQDSALLDLLLVKSSGQSMIFKDSVKFSNTNKFFLFQTCPNNTPILFDRQEGEASTPPAGDSIKVRFFYSSSDKIYNPNPGYNTKLVKRMRLQIFTFTPSANPNLPPPSSSFVQVYGAIDFNECGLSDYFSLARNKKYAFRIRDISPGIPSASSANLVQQLLPGTDIQLVTNAAGVTEWDFKRGKVFLDYNTDATDFQTFRVKKSIIPYQTISGDERKDTAYNGQFVFGLD